MEITDDMINRLATHYWKESIYSGRDGQDFDHNAFARAILALEQDAAIPVVPAWQPIETAPKDGREVLLTVKQRAGSSGKSLVGHYMEGGHCIEDHPPISAGWYFWNGCMFDRASEPTHWRPLPAAQSQPGNAPA